MKNDGGRVDDEGEEVTCIIEGFLLFGLITNLRGT